MPRTLIASQNALGSALSALPTALTWTAADVANGNTLLLTGKEILLIWNTHASTTYTVTLTSAADKFGRAGDIATANVVAGAIHAFGPINQTADAGWKSTGATASEFFFSANNAAVKFAVLKVP